MFLHKINEETFPNDWQVSRLDKVTKRGSGHTPDQQHREYWNGGIKWVSLADSSKLDNGYIYETKKEISAAGIANSSAVLHPAETVVISRDAGVGKSAILATPMAVSQHFITWQCGNSGRVNCWFLYYWLQFVKREFERQAVGSTIKTIGLPYFKKILFAHPIYREQKHIAEILSTWDQAIQTTEKLIKNSKAQKKALMQQLLTGKKRLPGFSGEWQQLKFTQIFERVTDKNRSGNNNVLTISGKRGLVNQRKYFNKRVASANLDGYTLLRQRDFAYNKSYSSGYPYGAIKPLERYEAGVVSSLYLCFRLTGDSAYCHDFFRHYFEGGLFDREIYAIAQEGARNHGLLNVSSKAFFATHLLTPSHQEQTSIAAVINTAEADQENLNNQLLALRRQKRSLMQQLLTGKRRVNVGKP